MKTIIYCLFSIIIISCQPTALENKSAQNSKKTTAWLPPSPYSPKDHLAIQLNDSAAILQIQAVQDPTLSKEEKEKLLSEAYNMLTKVLEIDPKYGLAMTNLSAVYLEKGDSLKALELIQRRLKLEPEMAEGWQAAGVFTDLMGDSASAINYYKKSIEIFDKRLKMGKEYSVPEDLLYYYDNWSGKAFSLLMSGRTLDAHNSIKALLEEAGIVMGSEAETYAAMLTKDRWSILKDMKQNDQ